MRNRRTTWLRVAAAAAVALALWTSTMPALAVPLEKPLEGSHGHGENAAHGESAGHGSAEGGINPLDVQTDLALWSGVLFLLLLGVLWRFAWRPIAQGLEKRENRIHEEIAAAERSNADARKLLDDYQQRLAEAGDEVRRMLDAARREAEQNGAQIVQQARAAAQVERDRALAEIDVATAGALKDLADRSATLAVELAGKIIGSQLDRTAHNRLIEQAVHDFVQTGADKN